MVNNWITNKSSRASTALWVAIMVLLLASLISGPYIARAGGPYVQITKTGPDTANPGDLITFTLTVTTYASGVATKVVVWDDLLYDQVDRYEIFRTELSQDQLDTLNAGNPVVIEVLYQVPCDAGGHTLDNDAYAQATFTDGTTSFSTNDHDVTIPRPDQVNCTPSIDLEKLVNGQDADLETEAVVVNLGDTALYEYIVKNTGDAVIRNIEVVDDNETPDDTSDDVVVGTISNLAPGQTQTFTRELVCDVAGLHTNVAQVTGTSSQTSGGQQLSDSDAANLICQTEMKQPGTGTPGYWMNHPEAWPVDEIMVGGETYTRDEAIEYMKMPVKGDKTLTMFPALVAAKLNVLIGNDDSCIADTIADADLWMATYGPVGSGVEGNSNAWKIGEPLYETLDDYNNGLLCAPSRDQFE
jgi:hypothetical protein